MTKKYEQFSAFNIKYFKYTDILDNKDSDRVIDDTNI